MDFSTLLQQSLLARDISANTFAKSLVGTKISRSSFYNYLSGVSVPTFEKACQIMEKTEVPFSKDDLLEVINSSIPQPYYSDKLSGSFKINYLDLDATPEELNFRIEETSKGMNDYIKKLIRKDLKEKILKEGKDY